MYSDPIQKEYSRLASQYDRRWSGYIHSTIQQTIQRLDLKSSDRVLDLGCGTGVLIQYLLNLAPEAEFVGLDASSEMLKMAKQKLPAAVDWHLGSANQLPFPAQSFSVVISTNAFHYFRQPAQTLREIRRVLKPEGRLVITDWCHDYWTCQFCDFFLRLFNPAHFRAYRVNECKWMLQNEGFKEVTIDRYKIDWFWGMMTAQAVKDVSAVPIESSGVRPGSLV